MIEDEYEIDHSVFRDNIFTQQDPPGALAPDPVVQLSIHRRLRGEPHTAMLRDPVAVTCVP